MRDNLSSGFQTMSDKKPAVQPQKMARGLNSRLRKKRDCTKEKEGLYYLCSENNGADQLHGNGTADLRLCFRICKKQVFS